MEKKSTSNPSPFLERLQKASFSPKVVELLEKFYLSYCHTLTENGLSQDPCETLFQTFCTLVETQLQSPWNFQPYHEQVREPFDYYTFGVEFIRPLVDKKGSTVTGLPYLEEIQSHLKQGHNVIFLANHQTEADPQAISILLESLAPKLAVEMIFIAGERVLNDPLAAPFSMGRNLLCIYSKRYIDHPPEQKSAKQLHNKRTMELMSELLRQGGKSIYVAPSGGRDRMNTQGVIEVAPFDPQSIEMLYLMAKKAPTPTYFYPLTLATYALLPPPAAVQKELGEMRLTQYKAIHLAVGPKISMDTFPGSTLTDKHSYRKARAEHIWQKVQEAYAQFPL